LSIATASTDGATESRVGQFIAPDGRAIVVLAGELDIAAVPLITDAFSDAIGQTRVGVIADLSRVSFIDASGLGALVSSANQAEDLPGGLSLCGIPGHMEKLLRIAGLSDRFLGALPPVTPASPVRYADPAGRNFGRGRQQAGTGVPLAAAAAVAVPPQSAPTMERMPL
jgi:anti-sigma B factor antagonist